MIHPIKGHNCQNVMINIVLVFQLLSKEEERKSDVDSCSIEMFKVQD